MESFEDRFCVYIIIIHPVDMITFIFVGQNQIVRQMDHVVFIFFFFWKKAIWPNYDVIGVIYGNFSNSILSIWFVLSIAFFLGVCVEFLYAAVRN